MVAQAQEADRCEEEWAAQKVKAAMDLVRSADSYEEASEKVRNGFLLVLSSFHL